MRPNSRLWLVGGGELDDSLKNQVKSKVHELGLDESVVFTGVRTDVNPPYARNGFIHIAFLVRRFSHDHD